MKSTRARGGRARVAILCVAAALVATLGHATAPPGRYTVATVNQIDTVLDTRTQLTWQRAPAVVLRAWSEAQNDCASLGAGWRLPSVEELETIVDETALAPAIDSTFSASQACYWTLTPFAGTASPPFTTAWCVDFLDGRQRLDPPTTNLVRCVR